MANAIVVSSGKKDSKNLDKLILNFKTRILRQTLYPLWLLMCGLLLAFFLYLPSLRAPFILDDLPKIADNSEIRGMEQFKNSLLHPYLASYRQSNHNDPSRPLTYFTYYLNYQWMGLRPGIYHLFNVLIHLGTTCLLFFLVRKISASVFNVPSETIPLLVAILFALHPAQASTVSYVFRRSDLLASFFYLGSFYLFILTLEKRSRLFLMLSCASFILSLFSKQSAVTLPVVLLGFDFIFLSDRNFSFLKEKIKFHAPFWILLFLYLSGRYFYLGGLGDLEAIDRIRPALYILNQPYIVMKYIKILLIPTSLCLDPLVIPATSFWELKIWSSWVGFGGLVVVIVGLTWIKGWISKVIQFSLAWFVIQLVPTSSFFSTTRLMVENRIYLAGLGLFLAALTLLFVFLRLDLKKGFFARENFMGSLLFISILILFSLFTWRRNIVYGNPVILWKEVTRLYPNHTLAYSHLGLAYKTNKKYALALDAFDQALRLDPQCVECYYNKGNLYLEQESYDLALECYQKVMELDPRFSRSYHNAALAYARKKQFNEAQALYRKTIELDPTSAQAYYNLGLLYYTQNRYNESLEFYRKAIELSPNYLEAYYNMGAAYFQMKDYPNALEKFEQALKLEPNHPVIRDKVMAVRRLIQSHS